jgi:hypothetical protein
VNPFLPGSTDPRNDLLMRRVGYEDEASTDGYDDYRHRAPSPPHASGGFYNPPPPAPANGFTQHPNIPITGLNQQYQPYPPDMTYPPPPPGPPPNSATMMGGASPHIPQVPPQVPPAPQVPPYAAPPATPAGPEHVSEALRVGRSTPEPEGAAARPVAGDTKGASALGSSTP